MADERTQGQGWRSDEVLAWTEREGPGRGPSQGGRRLWFLLAGAMALVFLGIMSSDTLCPEHRAWVLLLGGASLIAAGVAIVGLIDGWAGAPLLALASALGGVGIGLIDAVHDPSRGRLIALGFGLAFAMACGLVARCSLSPTAPASLPRPSATRCSRSSRCVSARSAFPSSTR